MRPLMISHSRTVSLKTEYWACCDIKNPHFSSGTLVHPSKRPPFGRYFIFSVSERLFYSLAWIFRARALTMTMRDHFHPPFSHCVRVTTRGQKTELILYSLKRPETQTCSLSSAALSSVSVCVWTFLKAFFSQGNWYLTAVTVAFLTHPWGYSVEEECVKRFDPE